MTIEQLAKLEQLVGDGVRLRNKAQRISLLYSLFRELMQPLPDGVTKTAEIRVSANIAELRFVDLSSQSRNATLELLPEDRRRLVALLLEFLEKQSEAVNDKLEAIPVGKDVE